MAVWMEKKSRVSRLSFLALASFLIAAFAASIPAFAQNEAIEGIRSKGLEFLQTLTQREYETYGQGKTPRLAVLFKDYHYLYNENKIATITQAWKDALAKGDKEDEEAFNRFRLFLIDNSIWQEAMPFVDDLAGAQLESGIQAGEKVITVRDAPIFLARESDRNIRRQLYLSYSQNAEREGVYLAQVNNLFSVLVKQKGFESYLDFEQQRKKIAFDELSRVANNVIAETDSLYTILLGEALSEDLDLRITKARTFDIIYLMQLHEFDEYFPKKKLKKKVLSSFEKLGFSPKAFPGLKIDLKEKGNKIAGFHSYIAIIPRKVYVSGKPVGGVSDYEGLLREVGQSLFYLNTKETRFEFRRLGPKTNEEIFGALFASLVGNPAWIRNFTDLPEDQLTKYLRRRALVELYNLRRTCAVFLFELKLYGGERTPWRDYNEILESALKWRHTDLDAKHYLAAGDRLHSAEKLRGLFLAAQIRKALRERYGDEWFLKSELGDELKTIWAKGLKPEPVELLNDLGASDVGPSALEEEIEALAQQ